MYIPASSLPSGLNRKVNKRIPGHHEWRIPLNLPGLDDENRRIGQMLAETRSQRHAGCTASYNDLKEHDGLEAGKLPILTRIARWMLTKS